MGQDTDQNLKTVPLADFHRRMGAKMVPFAGYEMPVQYPAGIIDEHKHTREKAGLFDVSHMGQAWLHGTDAAKALEKLVPGDVQALQSGSGRYTMITNDAGGIVDDLIVTSWGDKLFIVVNASRKHIDLPMIADAAAGMAELEIIEDRALIALQGPKAAVVVSGLAPVCATMAFMSAVETEINGIKAEVDSADVLCMGNDRIGRVLLSGGRVKEVDVRSRDRATCPTAPAVPASTRGRRS